MRTVVAPQSERSYRVLTGYLVSIKGSLSNTPRVEVAWSGPTEDRHILAGQASGSTSWKTEMPVKPVHYRVTTRIGEGQASQVDFEVVDVKNGYHATY
jgi:hypothetical protein